MKRLLTVALAVAVVALVVGAALAHGGGGPAAGGGGWGMMGPGMMGGGWGPGNCPGMTAGDQPAATQITEEKAKDLAQQYGQRYLPDFTVERLLPFTGMHMTMYQAELRGPDGETRILHVNPWGGVMPFGGAVTR